MHHVPLQFLIVDDDEGDRRQILRSLQRSGLDCECTQADTVRKGLQVFDSKRFDCVIIDYSLPGENGLEGIGAMRQRDAFLPVIMLTGQGNEWVASEALKRGAMDYICKSNLTSASIEAAIEGVLKRAGLNRQIAEQQGALAIFSKVLVHDMKAPLQSILGFAKLVEVFLRQDKFDREKIIKHAQRISEGAMRMDDLLNELYAYTEADAHPNFENLPLDKLMSDVLANLDAEITRSGARVIYDHLPVVCGDRQQILQLMQNLISNGIKYCRADIPQMHITAHVRSDSGCLIEVRDNGIGIPKEHHKSIFEPFRRLHSQGEFEGTGLGLAICKKIVEQHGGTIWCTSEARKGTSFFFTLPLVKVGDEPSVDDALDKVTTVH